MNKTKQCPYCKEQVPGNATKCSHCQSDLRSWMRKHPIASFFLIMVFIGPVVGSFRDEPSTQQTTQASSFLKRGETGYITSPNTSGDTDVLVATDEKTFDQMGKLMAVKDMDGLTKMLMAKEIFYVPNRTPILVIGGSMFAEEVRITGGDHKGDAVWIPNEWASK